MIIPAIICDLGGTFIRLAITDGPHNLYQIVKRPVQISGDSRPTQSAWNNVCEIIESYTATVIDKIKPDSPIIMSFPGPIAHPNRILDAPTVIGRSLPTMEPHSHLEHQTHRKIFLLNDVSAAAWYLSHRLDTNRFMVITISSGIGSKIFDRGHPRKVLDDIPYAGEIGHVPIDDSDDALHCDCGGKGHLGAFSSGRGVERLARKMARNDSNGFRASACSRIYGATADNLTNENHLVPAMLSGDRWALEVLELSMYPLARIMLAVILAVGLEKVVIIGGFAHALRKIYLDMLRNRLCELCDYRIAQEHIKNILIHWGQEREICLYGASQYYHENIGRQA